MYNETNEILTVTARRPTIEPNGNQPCSPATGSIDDGLRNAWQWLAMVTMTLDHIGFLYPPYDFLRYAGRLAMPLYALLFVATLRSGHVNHWRLLVIAGAAQLPYLLLFDDLRLNIIFGFSVFYGLTVAVRKHSLPGILLAGLAMCLPVSYGWYLYGTLAVFYWLDRPEKQVGIFAILTLVYTWMTGVHPRQLLAVGVPFIRGLRLPRPNKYLYRYFYPGHLLILLVIDICIMGYVVTPFGVFPKPDPSLETQDYYEYYDDSPEPEEMMIIIDD